MKHLAKIFQIGGIVIFALAVFITILFAEGYQYDPKSRDLVKKGIVYFEKLPGEAEIFVDGAAMKLSSNQELKLSPGPHALEIRQEGYISWKKQITVPKEQVLRFPEIFLSPIDESSRARPLVTFLDALSPQLRIESVSEKGVFFANIALHFGKYVELKDDAPFWVQDLPLRVSFRQLVPLSKETFVGRTDDNRLFMYTMKDQKLYPLEVPPVTQLVLAGKAVFALGNDGKVLRISPETGISATLSTGIPRMDSELFVALPAPVTNIESIEESGNRYLLKLHVEGKRLLLVATVDGSIVFQEGGVQASFLEDHTLSFTKGSLLVRYDVKRKEEKQHSALPFTPVWMSRVGNTFHFLFVTSKNELFLCDEDGENCALLRTLDGPFIVGSEDRTVFLTVAEGHISLLDFEARSGLPLFLEKLVSGIFGAKVL